MNSISKIESFSGASFKPISLPKEQPSNFVNFANIVCSRESTYRVMLDLTAFDLPAMLAASFRGFKNFLDTTFECLYGTAILFGSPFVTTFVGKVIGKLVLPKDLQNDTLNLLKFRMEDTKDSHSLKQGISRIASEEVEDKNFISSLFKKANRLGQASKFEKEAHDIKKFADGFVPTDELAKQIYKLKKYTIIAESVVEGTWSATVGLATRLFRKHVLKEDRFTGTKGYLSDQESSMLGEAEDISTFQKFVTFAMCFLSPITNSILLTKTENEESVKKSKFLQIIKDQLDMTHGIYPKLGLLLSYTVPPKWIGQIYSSQGNFERIEKLLKLPTVVASWWFGHRVTNGLLCKNADEKFCKEYKLEKGIFIEPDYYTSDKSPTNFFTRTRNKFPEPAKIQHIFRTIENLNLDKETKEKAIQEAEKRHAKCLYTGFALHAGFVWLMNMLVNYITKLRAKYALGG